MSAQSHEVAGLLDKLKVEFDAMCAKVAAVESEKHAYVTKMEAQAAELDELRTTLANLEGVSPSRRSLRPFCHSAANWRCPFAHGVHTAACTRVHCRMGALHCRGRIPCRSRRGGIFRATAGGHRWPAGTDFSVFRVHRLSRAL